MESVCDGAGMTASLLLPTAYQMRGLDRAVAKKSGVVFLIFVDDNFN